MVVALHWVCNKIDKHVRSLKRFDQNYGIAKTCIVCIWLYASFFVSLEAVDNTGFCLEARIKLIFNTFDLNGHVGSNY